MKIEIFVTGGTFDKEYNELTGELYFQDTHLPEMLKLGPSRAQVEIGTLMMVDSIHMTDTDREIIAHNNFNRCDDSIQIRQFRWSF